MEKHKNTVLYVSLAIAVIIIVVLGIGLIAQYNSKKEIAQVDIDYLVKAMVRDIATQELSNEEIERKSIEALTRLNGVIDEMANKRKLTILTKAVVISGAIDVTQEVQMLIKAKK